MYGCLGEAAEAVVVNRMRAEVVEVAIWLTPSLPFPQTHLILLL